jgi:hypothetical protein
MMTVQASLLLPIIHAALVTVAPGPAEECPSSAQVQAALESHADRLLAPRANRNGQGPLTLVISPVLATGETSFFLLDRSGLVRLYRTLPPPVGDRARDCAALADTVAFIVERYFDEVELPPLPDKKPEPAPEPAPKPAPPVEKQPKTPPIVRVLSHRHTLSFDAGRRLPGAAEDMGGIELKLSGAGQLTAFTASGTGLWLDLSGGVAGRPVRGWDYGGASGTVTVLRTAAQASLLLLTPTWGGAAYVGPIATGELLWIDATSSDHEQRQTRWGGAIGLRLGYLATWGDRLFLRLDVGAHASLRRQQIFTQSSGAEAILVAPAQYLCLGFGVGFWF